MIISWRTNCLFFHLVFCSSSAITVLSLNALHILLVFVHMVFIYSFSLLWPPTACYTILYVLYLLSFAPSHSLLSKCWHISFKWSVLISHSLFLSFLLPPPPHSPRRSWVCLRGINPQTTTPLLLLFLSFPPFSFPSPLTVSSDFYCQRLDVSKHLCRASFHRRLFDFQSVG